jgi:hypothetical protein
MEKVDQDKEIIKTKLSKNFIDKMNKKYKKKQQQAQGCILRAENKKYEEIIYDTPTKYMLVTHFGNGDECD